MDQFHTTESSNIILSKSSHFDKFGFKHKEEGRPFLPTLPEYVSPFFVFFFLQEETASATLPARGGCW